MGDTAKTRLRKVVWALRSLKQHRQKQVRGFTLRLPGRAPSQQNVADHDSGQDEGCPSTWRQLRAPWDLECREDVAVWGTLWGPQVGPWERAGPEGLCIVLDSGKHEEGP